MQIFSFAGNGVTMYVTERGKQYMEILKAENLIKIYGKGDNQVKALDGVSLSVEKGEFVAVVGTSGSGKSTLLHMLGGLDRPDSGKVQVEGKDIFTLKEEALTIFRRRKIGFVFQAYNLVPVLSVYENVVLPVELDGKKADRKFVEDILDTLGIREKAGNLPGSSPADSSSGRPSQGLWRQNRRSFSAMSLRGTWTAVPPRTCWGF